MLPDLATIYKTSQTLSKLHVSRVRTITDMLQNVPSAKALFSEIDHLLGIYLQYLSVKQQLKGDFLACSILKHTHGLR